MKRAEQYQIRYICYIVAVFMLIAGMCQGRIEADFCFPCDQNGRIASSLSDSASDNAVCEAAIEFKSVLHELGMSVTESRRDNRRTLGRMQGIYAVFTVVKEDISVHSHRFENKSLKEDPLTAVILQYLHNQDGKKRFI